VKLSVVHEFFDTDHHVERAFEGASGEALRNRMG
jgi:hypothetical protein